MAPKHHRTPPALDITFDLDGEITAVAVVKRDGTTEDIALDGDIAFLVAGAYVVAQGDDRYGVLMLDEETGYYVGVAHGDGEADLEAIALETYELPEAPAARPARELVFTFDEEDGTVTGLSTVARDGTVTEGELDDAATYTVQDDYVVVTVAQGEDTTWVVYALDADSGTYKLAAAGEGDLDLETLDEVVAAWEPGHGHGPHGPRILDVTFDEDDVTVIGTAKVLRDGTLEEDAIEEDEAYQLIDGYLIATVTDEEEGESWTVFVQDEETGYFVAAATGDEALDTETLDELTADFEFDGLPDLDRDYQGSGGHDHFRGGRGNDRMAGGRGRDHLDGGDGEDVLKGGQGRDVLSGGAGKDKLRGGSGDDEMHGGRGHDRLRGDGGDDHLEGDGGRDRLFGGEGDDLLRGGKGDDLLEGGEDADRLGGGKGDDTLNGGAGDDTLKGHAGADVFVFAENDGADTIVDFTDGEDLLQIDPIGSFDDLVLSMQDEGTLIDYGSGTILLLGVDSAALDASDFLFS